MNQFVLATAALMGAVMTPGGPQTAPKTSPMGSNGTVLKAFGTSARAAAKPAASALRSHPVKTIEGAQLFSSAAAPTSARSVPFDVSPLSNQAPAALGGKWTPAPAGNGGSQHLGTVCACAGSPPEGEPDCGIPADTFNGGCNSSPEMYSSISLGGSVCGASAWDGGFRDTDWYQFSVATTTNVSWTVHAEFGAQAVIAGDHQCPSPTIYANVSGPACTDVVATATLGPGDYIAFVSVDFTAPLVTCGVNNTYHAALTETAPPTGCSIDDGHSEGSVGVGGLGGGENLYLHREGAPGASTQVSSISVAWGSPAIPGFGPPEGSPATIRLFKDPNDDGVPDDVVQVASKDFFTTGADTDVLQTVAFDAPVDVNGVYFIAVSIVSGDNVFPVSYDINTPSAGRGWFVAVVGGPIDYSNLPASTFFGPNPVSVGIDGVFLLRADCQSVAFACAIDDGVSDDTGGYGFEAGEKLFFHRAGAVGELAEVDAVSMSWGTPLFPGFSVPNGTPAVVRIFEDPNDDGIPDDAVLIASANLTVQDVDTDIFHATAFASPVIVQGVYFYGVSVFGNGNGQFPMGYDETTPSGNRAWFCEQQDGSIDYSNLPGNTRFGEVSVTYGIDGVHMLRADCHPLETITSFCAPGVSGLVTCPCGNPQVPADSVRGCNNFAGGGTGGAILAGSGAPTIGGDSLAMDVTAGLNSNVTVLFQGTTNTKSARAGAGVACVGGSVIRLYSGNQSAGAISFPNNGVPVHDQSSAKGFPISAPVSLYYYAAYRNSAANGQPGCPGFTFGFNTTNAVAVVWTP